MSELILTFEDFSVSLKKFPQNGYERILSDNGDTEYSIDGTPIDSGLMYEQKNIWNLSAFVSKEEWDKLQSIYTLSESKRQKLLNYRVLVDDYLQEITEVLPRTREVAPGSVLQNLNSSVVRFASRFYARIHQPSSQKITNSYYPYLVKLTLKELDKVSSTPSSGDSGEGDNTTNPPVTSTRWLKIYSSTNIQASTNYIIGAPVDLTLPINSGVGDTITILGETSGWRIRQGNGQTIRLGEDVTTNGTSGFLQSTSPGDSLVCVCTSANQWQAFATQGNFIIF